jgi:hypothetical protein
MVSDLLQTFRKAVPWNKFDELPWCPVTELTRLWRLLITSPTTKLGCCLTDNRHILKPNYYKPFEVNEYQTTCWKTKGKSSVR